MKYKNYSNQSYWFWLFIIAFILFGGYRLVFRILAVAIPLVVQLLPFIIIGFIFYSLMSRNNRIGSYVRANSADHVRFVELLIHLMIRLVKADDRVDQRELSVIRAFFVQVMMYNSTQMLWVEDLIKTSLKTDYSLEELCSEFNQRFNRDSKMILLQLLYRIASADGSIGDSERRMIDQMVSLLGIHASDHDQVRSMFMRSHSQAEDYHKILGVSRSATKEEIKQAYKKAIRENHPDKVHHLGKEFQKVAEERMKKINEAYEAIK